jgi:hypothetical protein
MPEPELSLLFLRPLNRLGMNYMVSGREGGSEKHLRDIRAICHISGDQIHHGALADWIVRQGVDAQWKHARL